MVFVEVVIMNFQVVLLCKRKTDAEKEAAPGQVKTVVVKDDNHANSKFLHLSIVSLLY